MKTWPWSAVGSEVIVSSYLWWSLVALHNLGKPRVDDLSLCTRPLLAVLLDRLLLGLRELGIVLARLLLVILLLSWVWCRLLTHQLLL